MTSKIFITNYINTPIGRIPVVPNFLNFNDRIGALGVRLTIGRRHYDIEPGLYAVGNPTAESPVLVSANYKLSFDSLRKELREIEAWILVLDTKGINVWCAAGKGTFGTEELITKIRQVNLDKVVSHRQLIVPQLGAPGIAAHLVEKATGYKVTYGPIRANDIIAFINAANKALEGMREVRFSMVDRLKVIPVELVQGFKYVSLISAVLFLLSGFDSTEFSLDQMLRMGLLSVVYILLAFMAGAALAPLLLPFIPGRAFSLKGFNIIIPIFILLHYFSMAFQALHVVEKISWFLLMSSLSSFCAMNFTGATTYTSLSGVKKEMQIAVPLQIMGFVLGLILWIVSRFS